MDKQNHRSGEHVPALSTESTSYTGAFFPNSRCFVVKGGTFVNNNTSEATPSDFLRLPLGSIDLRNEIRLDRLVGVVSDQRSVRRTHAARIAGHHEPMTVALYQGDNAETEYRQDISRHSGLRHPHILQIYATANSFGIHAAIFHDDLIPYEQFLESFRHSAILKAYIIAYHRHIPN
ncbi:hypothetical protein C8R45DRAFT_383382 [Mycena sanguinolenta]|nr:hypothetical protein C8R45DRAFT_383382 [Mycena sanguinolenta]